MKSLSKFFAVATLIITAASCNTKVQTVDFDYGKVENGVYLNKYFEFKMTLPKDWVIQSKEEIDNLSNTGKEMIAGDDEKMKAAINASEINSANLLSAFQYEIGSAVEYNPSIIIVSENIKKAPGIKNGKDYLFQARKIILQSQFKYDYLSEDFKKEIINGTEFYSMDAQSNFMGLDIKQTYYSTIQKGFSFNIIISYVSDDQKETLLEAIKTHKFK